MKAKSYYNAIPPPSPSPLSSSSSSGVEGDRKFWSLHLQWPFPMLFGIIFFILTLHRPLGLFHALCLSSLLIYALYGITS